MCIDLFMRIIDGMEEEEKVRKIGLSAMLLLVFFFFFNAQAQKHALQITRSCRFLCLSPFFFLLNINKHMHIYLYITCHTKVGVIAIFMTVKTKLYAHAFKINVQISFRCMRVSLISIGNRPMWDIKQELPCLFIFFRFEMRKTKFACFLKTEKSLFFLTSVND